MAALTCAQFTELGDPFLEAAIRQKIDEIVRGITAEVRPKSLILIGSLGKGEASARIVEGKLQCFSDVDIIIIAGSYIPAKTLGKLSDTLSRQTGLDVGISNASPEFRLNMAAYRHFHRAWRPSIDDYDMRYGSKVIYGQDYPGQMPAFKPETIPMWEGIRQLFNRMIEAMACLPASFFERKMNLENGRVILFQICKIVLACQDSLLLSERLYHHSYRKRNELFQKEIGRFGKLGEIVPDPKQLAKWATDYKLRSCQEPVDALKLWFDARALCDSVLRYLLFKEMGITFNKYPQFQQQYLNSKILKQFHRGLFSATFIQNLRSCSKMYVIFHRLPPARSLMGRRAWAQLIYSSIPLLYFSLTEADGVDESYLDACQRTLNLKLTGESKDTWSKFESLTGEVLRLRSAVCY